MNLVKIDKAKARKLYYEHKTIYLLPSKVALDTNIQPCAISQIICHDRAFEFLVNEYKRCNCNERLGKIVHYYIDTTPQVDSTNSFGNNYIRYRMTGHL